MCKTKRGPPCISYLPSYQFNFWSILNPLLAYLTEFVDAVLAIKQALFVKLCVKATLGKDVEFEFLAGGGFKQDHGVFLFVGPNIRTQNVTDQIKVQLFC